MGHTVTDWQVKVLGRLRDVRAQEASGPQIYDAGILPAIAQFSVDRPQTLVTETTGNTTNYYPLPAGWVDGFSQLNAVECPARTNPPQYLDPQNFRLTRSNTNVAVTQIFLDQLFPTAAQYIRFWFTAPWPIPTDDSAVDQIGDLAFEAVASLAAALICDTLVVEQARRQSGTTSADFGIGDANPDQIQASARLLRGSYLRFLGIDPDVASAPGGDVVAVSRPFDFDPQFYSVFHGGRR